MFGYLDDPAGVPPGNLTEVLGQAGAIRLRRRRRLAGAGSATALSVVATLVVVLGPSADQSALRPVDGPTPTASATVTESAAPKQTAGASQEPPADGTGLVSGTAPPSAGPYEDVLGFDPYGKPGWRNDYITCYPATDVPSSAPTPGARLTIELDESAYPLLAERWSIDGADVNGDVHGTATIHNDSDDRLAFTGQAADGVVYDGSGRLVSSYHGDNDQKYQVDLRPGGKLKFRFAVRTTTCGKRPYDDSPTLAPGHYTVAARITWSQDGKAKGIWASERAPVELYPPGPCLHDGTQCGALPATGRCTTRPLSGETSYERNDALTLSVSTDTTTVKSGEPLVLIATIANTDPDHAAEITLYDGMDGGWLFGGNSGYEEGGYRMSAPRTRKIAIGPEDETQVTITVPTRRCTDDRKDLGDPLPPGYYRLMEFGVYVHRWGWWSTDYNGSTYILVTP